MIYVVILGYLIIGLCGFVVGFRTACFGAREAIKRATADEIAELNPEIRVTYTCGRCAQQSMGIYRSTAGG